MKKRSLISMLVVMAMLVTTFASMFAIGVNAAAATQPYTFENDAKALEGGAIAKFSNGGYAKTLDDVFALGGTHGNVTMLVPELSVTSIAINYASRTFTVSGGENGFTLKTSANSSITGTGVLTLDGFNVTLTAAAHWIFRLETGGTKVVIKNSTMKAENTVHCSVMVLQANANLTLGEGARLISSNQEGSVSGRTPASENGGVLPNGANTKLIVKDGATIETYGNCLTTAWSGAYPIIAEIEGGTFISKGTNPGATNSVFYLSDANNNISIIGGTFTSKGMIANVNATTTMTISGGNFSTEYADVEAMLYFKSGSTNSTLNISGGSFYFEDDNVIKFEGSGSTATISGGIFEGHGGDSIMLGNAGTTINVTGGEFIASRVAGMLIAHGTDAKITVDGGNFYATNKYGAVKSVFKSNDGKGEVEVNKATVYGAETTTIGLYYTDNISKITGTKNITEGVAINAGTLEKGAAVRTAKDSSGIRFQSKLDKGVVTSVAAIDANYVIGTLIVPYDYLVDAQGNTVCEFTKAALDKAGKQYLNIVAKDGINDMGTCYLINAAMINVSKANYDRDFAAVAYITYKTANGTVTLYSAWNEENNVRNIEEVAYMALDDVAKVGDTVKDAEGADVELTAENAYELGYNVVTEWYEYNKETGVATAMTGTAYTKYSTAQRDVFEKYIGKANA